MSSVHPPGISLNSPQESSGSRTNQEVMLHSLRLKRSASGDSGYRPDSGSTSYSDGSSSTVSDIRHKLDISQEIPVHWRFLSPGTGRELHDDDHVSTDQETDQYQVRLVEGPKYGAAFWNSHGSSQVNGAHDHQPPLKHPKAMSPPEPKFKDPMNMKICEICKANLSPASFDQGKVETFGCGHHFHPICMDYFRETSADYIPTDLCPPCTKLDMKIPPNPNFGMSSRRSRKNIKSAQKYRLPASKETDVSPELFNLILNSTRAPVRGLDPETLKEAPVRGMNPETLKEAPVHGMNPETLKEAPVRGLDPETLKEAPVRGMDPETLKESENS
eukprot:131506_1